MTRRVLASSGAVLLAAVMLALAQAPQAPAQPPAGAAPGTAQAYSYNPEGRRDPFVSLLRRGTDGTRPQGRPAEGVGAIAVNEVNVKGILQSHGRYIALVQGADGRTHLVRVNDRLADGVVRSITSDTLIIMQDVNDPLSPTKQREVRKTLRGAGDQK